MSFTAKEINSLIYSHLLQSGFTNSAREFFAEAKFSELHKVVVSGVDATFLLTTILQRGAEVIMGDDMREYTGDNSTDEKEMGENGSKTHIKNDVFEPPSTLGSCSNERTLAKQNAEEDHEKFGSIPFKAGNIVSENQSINLGQFEYPPPYSSLICQIPLSKLSRWPRPKKEPLIQPEDSIGEICLQAKETNVEAESEGNMYMIKDKRPGTGAIDLLDGSNSKPELASNIAESGSEVSMKIKQELPDSRTTDSRNKIFHLHSILVKNAVSVSNKQPEQSSVSTTQYQFSAQIHSPQYISYFEKTNPCKELDTLDHLECVELGNSLKHKADKEVFGGTLHALSYLESVAYFVTAGTKLEKNSPNGAFKIYEETVELVRHISFRKQLDNRSELSTLSAHDKKAIQLQVLGMKCHALLALKLFKRCNKDENIRTALLWTEYFKHNSTLNEFWEGTPGLTLPYTPMTPRLMFAPKIKAPSHHSHRPANDQLYCICKQLTELTLAHILWDEADELVGLCQLENFFIRINRTCGPLTLHSSMSDLAKYVKCGVEAFLK